ncbi:hypothetical protein E1281_18320 [Actinomadura sp. KC345]|nr:hypothetical protein E1281_18320 [Actinomadura sp. KC345]
MTARSEGRAVSSRVSGPVELDRQVLHAGDERGGQPLGPLRVPQPAGGDRLRGRRPAPAGRGPVVRAAETGLRPADRADADGGPRPPRPYERARDIVATLVDALPSGSHFAIAEADDTHPPLVESMRAYAESGAVPYRARSRSAGSSPAWPR